MKKPFNFYSQEKTAFEKEAALLKSKSFNLSVFRFAVFLSTSFLIYIMFGSYPAVFIIAFSGILLFSFLVIKQVNLQRKRALIAAKININKIEIDVSNSVFHDLNAGKEFVNPLHSYSNDIDLFGVGSFFNIQIERLRMKEERYFQRC